MVAGVCLKQDPDDYTNLSSIPFYIGLAELLLVILLAKCYGFLYSKPFRASIRDMINQLNVEIQIEGYQLVSPVNIY